MKWFQGGILNASYNCLDRHVESGGGDKVAFHWEGEPGDRRTITYSQLYQDVCRFANGMKALGIGRGDRVVIYLGMVPELPVAMLACARLGAAHSVVFGGFSAEALRDRINDAGARLLITADGGFRRGAVVPLRRSAEQALEGVSTIEHVITLHRTGEAYVPVAGRDHTWEEVVADQPPECPPEHMDAEDVLYLLYTSGTTGKPKGIVHTTGSYMTGVAATHKLVFGIQDDDVYWAAADIGWVTGHSYIVYGPLANHTTGVIYEGAPDWPDKDRLWQVAARYGVTILYTAPTAIRTFMRWGPEYPQGHNLSSLPVGIGGGAHQPGSLDLVLEVHRRRAMPDRRHLVANRNRRHHDHATAGGHPSQTRLGDPAVPVHRGRYPGRVGSGGQPPGGRGGGGGPARRHPGSGDSRIRDAEVRLPARWRDRRRAAGACGQDDRKDRTPPLAGLHHRPSQDAVRKDHAPALAGSAGGRPLGDVSTLANAEILEQIRDSGRAPDEE